MLASLSYIKVAEPILQRARGMVDFLREKAEQINEQRSLPSDVLTSLADAGLLNVLRPARFGGQQLSLKLAMQVSHELARGDASAAWVHAVYISHDHVVGLFPEKVQQEYWESSELPLSASSYMPSGKATPVEGGYILSGTWSFCSGIDNANWLVVGAIVGMLEGDKPVPDRRFFLVPSTHYTILDDWQVMGLRGTGSKSAVIDQAFVPHVRILSDSDIGNVRAPGSSTHSTNEFKYPTWPLLNFTLVGLASKIALNAYECAVAELNANKTKPNPLFDSRRHAAAIHLAEASAKIDAAELIYSRALNETFDFVDAGKQLPLALRVRNRRDQCFSVRLAQEAASILLSIGGARGLKETGVVQRAHRDLCAVGVHPGANWDATALSFGNVAMGGAPTEMIF